MFDVLLLKTFVTVVDEEGFSRAAEKLHLTQSAVSGHLRRLEEQVGKPLLKRTTRSQQLTPDGERLIAYARTILALNRDAWAQLTRRPFHGRVRIGVSEDFVEARLLRAFQDFAAQYPGMEIDVQVGIPGTLLNLMKQGDLELEDLAAASELLLKLRPHIRKFQSQPVTDLVNGNLCVSLGYSGDMTQAQRTSDSAGKSTKFEYRIPREGTTVWMDTMAIPVDAKHPEYAYAFINFVMRPENMAAISNFTGYPTSNAKARSSVDATMRNNPDIYLDDATYERLITGKDIPQSDMRARMRTWTKFKTATTK